MADPIQRFELGEYESPVFCMFCGKEVIGDLESSKPKDIIKPCIHTLFIATDEAFEYRSPRFNQNTGLNGDDDDLDVDIGDHSYDSFTDMVNIEKAIKLAMNDGCLGAYVGFAPTEE